MKRFVIATSLLCLLLLSNACLAPEMSGEANIQKNAKAWFGVGHLETSATDEAFTGPGDQAVLLGEGLQAELVTDQVAVMADQIAFWPNANNPTHLIVANEQWSGSYPTPDNRESVQRVDLATGEVTTILYGLAAVDGVRVTPWGTILATEEESDGKAYEIFNPMEVKEAHVLDRETGEADNPNVVVRPALGSFSWEGIALLPDGTLYAGDELRPQNGLNGGAIYKFVPDHPYQGGTITDPDDSPFASGKLYALSIGARVRGDRRDFGPGNVRGKGFWVELVDPAHARDEANEKAASAFYRPEDMDVNPIKLAQGIIEIAWTATGNAKGANYGEVVRLWDHENPEAPTGRQPEVQTFVEGNPELNQPDNIAYHPITGDIYVIEDNSHGDVWACKADGPDLDRATEGCIRILSVRDPESEPTGFIFTADGKTAYLNLQHRFGEDGETGERQHDDLLKITGF